MKRIETKGSKVKKLAGLGLSIGLLFALTGCGKQPAAAAQASDAQTSDVQTKESTEVKEEPAKAENKEPVKIGLASDAINLARGITLLKDAGLIEVSEDAGFLPELTDITKYNYNIEIVPTQSNTLVATLDDFAASAVNGTFAIPAGLNPERDGLIIEKQEPGSGNPFINVIVARTEDKDNETYAKIVKAYQSQENAEYILEKNKGASVPAFDYDPNYTVPDTFVSDVEGYQTTADGSTTVKIGVCGSGEGWRVVQKVLDESGENILLDIVVFDAYNLPNEALNSGEIDLNSFQHIAYLNSEIESQGYDLTPIGDTAKAPLTLYSKKVSSIDELKELAGEKVE